jgi:hypothetical protein
MSTGRRGGTLPRVPPPKKWTRERIEDRLRAFHREYGYSPGAGDLSRRDELGRARADAVGLPWFQTVRREYGSLNAALEAAGLETRPRWSGPRPRGA